MEQRLVNHIDAKFKALELNQEKLFQEILQKISNSNSSNEFN